MYMWSDVLSGPEMRSTEQGKVSSVLSYGGSQIYFPVRPDNLPNARRYSPW